MPRRGKNAAGPRWTHGLRTPPLAPAAERQAFVADYADESRPSATRSRTAVRARAWRLWCPLARPGCLRPEASRPPPAPRRSHESGRVPRHRRHSARRRAGAQDRGADRRHRAADGQRHLRHRPAHGPRHHARHEARHDPRPRGRRRRRGGRRARAQLSRSATASSSARPSAAATARTAAPATTRSATTPTPTARRRAPRSSAARSRPARSTACRPSGPASRSPTSACVKLPDEVSDDQAILLSDIFPTGVFRRRRSPRSSRATRSCVFGCGPVGPVRHRQRQAPRRRARLRRRHDPEPPRRWPASPGRRGHRLQRRGSRRRRSRS